MEVVQLRRQTTEPRSRATAPSAPLPDRRQVSRSAQRLRNLGEFLAPWDEELPIGPTPRQPLADPAGCLSAPARSSYCSFKRNAVIGTRVAFLPRNEATASMPFNVSMFKVFSSPAPTVCAA